ncbi:hypothetical protein ASPZODRAFT_66535 [Penicilliopsis zonata CBS 506.65]|uniref:Uncharacterized protein n=1 Tax=Penicilliopsis zonata CBS 506.65 TaxID=1073090 RepID=A0A1L9SI39_9EURO|nr:hypothetical protein ASPZODRAFT_66535 [Penicilliopsis zonata CBS 506.65]OJJ46797.1 hypothetical protein ASPZODRAFT_66535 [Penicilliopsis zonata CBS 506.65]
MRYLLFASLPTAQAAANGTITGYINISKWGETGMAIRARSRKECLVNLSVALQAVSVLDSAEYNGAAGALSLLPTAGALLGSPTREMWLVFQLMPIAGLLSMFLSLGGNLTPSHVGDYTDIFQQRRFPRNTEDGTPDDTSDSVRFARQVKKRAEDDTGGGSYARVWIGIFLQVCLIATLLIAMYYCQRGAVITWWCHAWGWMYFWYFLVTATSIMDNIFAAPFSQNYTMRVCKAPSNLHLSDTASRVIPRTSNRDSKSYPSALDRLEAGINTHNRVMISPDSPSTMSRTCFYAVISVQGVSRLRALMQTVARAATVTVYAFGTALFASATLLPISVALMVLSLVLGVGILGRVVAMWIAAEMNAQNAPICHAVVASRDAAAEYIQRIMEEEGLMVEMEGHLIVNGVCLLRRNRWMSWSRYIGLLARPFDLVSFAKS